MNIQGSPEEKQKHRGITTLKSAQLLITIEIVMDYTREKAIIMFFDYMLYSNAIVAVV